MVVIPRDLAELNGLDALLGGTAGRRRRWPTARPRPSRRLTAEPSPGPPGHTSDTEAGIRRVRAGRGFRYRAPDGSPVDGETRRWIQRLAIPPAWTDVWISPDPDGHLLATGRDARGRKQYRYHPEYRRRRDDSKFERLAAFGAALPRLRRRVAIDLRRRGLPREKVLAALVALLDETSLRVGGEAYARVNRSYGLTTLGSRHAVVSAGAVRLRFRGKSGQLHDVRLRDRRLARLVRRCQELPGQRLFRTRPRTVAGRRSCPTTSTPTSGR